TATRLLWPRPPRRPRGVDRGGPQPTPVGAAGRLRGGGLHAARPGARRGVPAPDAGAAPGDPRRRPHRGRRAALFQPLRLLRPDPRSLLRPVHVLLLCRRGRPARAQGAVVLPAPALPRGERADQIAQTRRTGTARDAPAFLVHQPQRGPIGLVRTLAVSPV